MSKDEPGIFNSEQPMTASPFDAIRKERLDEQTGLSEEYWSARDLSRLLGYGEYRFFKNAISKAKIACENSEQNVNDHFVQTHEMVTIGSGAKRRLENVHLSRYACYLVVENADPSKPLVALGQTYFAFQARLRELGRADNGDLSSLNEDQRRLLLHSQLTDFNRQLALATRRAGIIRPEDFAVFQDHGYQGLYGGLKVSDIKAKKGLKPDQPIIDYMNSEELGANIFRATQTEAKLKRDRIAEAARANQTHHEIGRGVRGLIEKFGGTMPEELPVPAESIRQLEQKEQQKRHWLNSQSELDGSAFSLPSAPELSSETTPDSPPATPLSPKVPKKRSSIARSRKNPEGDR